MNKLVFPLFLILLSISGCLVQGPKDCTRVLVYNSKNDDCRSVCQDNFENWDTTNYVTVDKCPSEMLLDHCTCECVKKGQTVSELYYQAHGTYPECGNGCEKSHGITEETCKSMGG